MLMVGWNTVYSSTRFLLSILELFQQSWIRLTGTVMAQVGQAWPDANAEGSFAQLTGCIDCGHATKIAASGLSDSHSSCIIFPAEDGVLASVMACDPPRADGGSFETMLGGGCT
jgi:hypothetical protein